MKIEDTKTEDSASLDFSLGESMRRLLEDDDPRTGHAHAVLRQVGINDPERLHDVFAPALAIAALLVSRALYNARDDGTGETP